MLSRSPLVRFLSLSRACLSQGERESERERERKERERERERGREVLMTLEK